MVDDLITITVSRRYLRQLIESADVRADQLEGKSDEYLGDQDSKVAYFIREAIAHVGGACDYDISTKPVIEAHPDTDEHRAACLSCIMAHDKGLPDA